MSIRLLSALAIAASLTACATAPGAPNHSYSFGLWGDMPYKKAGDDSKLPAVLNSINASDIAFSVYDGDIKDGSSKCTDDIYVDALKMFGKHEEAGGRMCLATTSGPIATALNNGGLRRARAPGSPAQGDVPYQLRAWARPLAAWSARASSARNMSRTRASSYGGVVFAGVNVPGSNNNVIMSAKECSGQERAQGCRSATPANAEYLERDAANIEWLEASLRASGQGRQGPMDWCWWCRATRALTGRKPKTPMRATLPEFLRLPQLHDRPNRPDRKVTPARSCLCMATRIISRSTSRSTAPPSCCPTSPACRPSAAPLPALGRA